VPQYSLSHPRQDDLASSSQIHSSLTWELKPVQNANSEAEAALPPFDQLEGHNWFYQSSKESVCIYLFRQHPVLSTLHLRSAVHGYLLCRGLSGKSN
jgi:hypothetical protein